MGFLVSRRSGEGAPGHAEVTARRFRVASPSTALVAGIVVAVLLAAFVPVLALARQLSLGSFTPVAIYAPSAAVGFLIARRRPSNPIGWLLLVGMGAGVLGTDADYYAWAVYGVGRHGLPVAWLAVLLGQSWQITFVMALPLVILLFPDGLPRPRVWKWVVVGFVSLAAISLACQLVFAATALIDHHVNANTVNNGPGGGLLLNQPRGTHWLTILPAAFEAAAALLLVASVIHQVSCYRGMHGERRQQLRWLMSGGMVCVVAIALLPTATPGTSLLSQVWSQVPWIAFAALPASISVAVLRYRLYDIDRLISRTLAYAVLTALLVGTFVGLIALTTDVLSLSGRVGVATSTLAAAALFNPLRVRVQHLVDRRFNRARYDAEATVAAFTARLRDAVEIDTIRADLLDAVSRAVEPTHASVWIKP